MPEHAVKNSRVWISSREMLNKSREYDSEDIFVAARRTTMPYWRKARRTTMRRQKYTAIRAVSIYSALP